MDEIDGFESPTQGPPKAARPQAMANFEIEKGLGPISLDMAESFKFIADNVCDNLPEGTVRTMLLEKLTDLRGSVIRAFKDMKQ